MMANFFRIMARTQVILAILLLSSLVLMSSCKKEDDPISRRYPCRFQFYADQHPTSIIVTACKSPGSYVYIYTEVDSKHIRHVYALSNDGKSPVEDNLITTDKEVNYTAYLLGANNAIGLIVGCSNFNGLVAYDRTCPNCVGLQPLAWATNRQQVSCGNCHRTYNLETGTIASGDGGDALLRYGCNFDGARLSVGN
jgi:ribosomal protein S27AE